jgi:GT2 family glycosyltransferase
VEIIKKYDDLLKNGRYPVGCKGIELRWWSKKDHGCVDAVNQGFTIAKGDIIGWINSDDFYEPNAFAFVAKKYAENPNIDFFYGDMYLLDEQTKQKTLCATQQGTYEELTGFDTKALSVYAQSAFFTKRILDKIGLLDEKFTLANDYDLLIRVFKNGTVLYCHTALANFRIWPGAKTASGKEKDRLERTAIRKKHHLPIVDTKTIYKITQGFPFNFLRNNFPRFYATGKDISYRFLNNLKY